jgi:hypothetical protein
MVQPWLMPAMSGLPTGLGDLVDDLPQRLQDA